MNREVYTDPKVSDIIAASFVPIKLNAESSRRLTYDEKQYTEEEFARAIGVTGYPTTVFLEANAEPITLVPGFMDAERFTSVLTYIGEDHFRSMSYEDFLQKTDRNR
jgi:thioredoxin-related protein